MTKLKRQWADISGYEDKYLVSNLGEVYSIPTGIILKGGYMCGYLVVNLTGCDSRQQTYPIHRLVAKEFVPNPDNKTDVNHMDGVKTNNVATNLEWVTPAENAKHAIETGLVKTRGGLWGSRSEEEVRAKFQEAEEIRRIYREENISQRKLAKRFNKPQSTVGDILTERFWKPEDYEDLAVRDD